MLVQAMALFIDCYTILTTVAFMRFCLVGHHKSIMTFAYIWLNAFGILTRQFTDRFAFMLWTICKHIVRIAFALIWFNAVTIDTSLGTMGYTNAFGCMMNVTVVACALLWGDTITIMAATWTRWHTLHIFGIPVIAYVALANLWRNTGPVGASVAFGNATFQSSKFWFLWIWSLRWWIVWFTHLCVEFASKI